MKAARRRHEADVIAQVRAACVARDGVCRVGWKTRNLASEPFGACSGPSEWAHAAGKRRFQTRGQPPEERHTVEGSFMLCRSHHAAFDQHAYGIAAVTDRGAEGPLAYVRGDAVFIEGLNVLLSAARLAAALLEGINGKVQEEG